MLKYIMLCPYCNHSKLYTLKTEQLKCANCKKKFSPKRLEQDKNIIKYFCQNKSANEISKILQLNYVTVKNKLELLRKLIANYLENQYNEDKVIEYDEYIYLEKSKKNIKENIFDAQNFLTFHYDDKIYNLLMPNLNRYKREAMNEEYIKEFSKFMRFNKITKLEKKENIIPRFWEFFEESITKYKGIKSDHFFYYLKECEFKFNYDIKTQEEILAKLLHTA